MKLTGLVVLSITFVGHIYCCGGNTSTSTQKHKFEPIFHLFSPPVPQGVDLLLLHSVNAQAFELFPLVMQPCPVLVQHHPVETECTGPLGLTSGSVKLFFTSLAPPFLYSELYNSFWLCLHFTFFRFFHSALFHFFLVVFSSPSFSTSSLLLSPHLHAFSSLSLPLSLLSLLCPVLSVRFFLLCLSGHLESSRSAPLQLIVNLWIHLFTPRSLGFFIVFLARMLL